MLPLWKLPPGAPGVFRAAPIPFRELTGVRMDVCAFVGVAPRGPAREVVLDVITRNGLRDTRVPSRRQLRRTVPMAVESFDEYRRLYGGFEGPGLLPYAVASFFEQGGQRAYIARIVHDYGNEPENNGRVATGAVAGVTTTAGKLVLRARNEGAWGNDLHVDLSFRFAPMNPLTLPPSPLTLPEGDSIPAGTLLRLTMGDGRQVYHFVTQIVEHGAPQPGRSLFQATLDQAVVGTASRAEIVEAEVIIRDGQGREERHSRQGLSSLHPRWLGATLAYDSQLVAPDESWVHLEIRPDPAEPGTAFRGGDDAYAAIAPEDFFDDFWTPSDEEPGDGVHSLVQLADLSLLVVPDLYSPRPLVPEEPVLTPVSLAGPTFKPCVDLPAAAEQQAHFQFELEGLRLDPRTELDVIQNLQGRLVDFASERRSFIVLLDVPPGLSQRKVLAWRSRFDSSYAAAYAPWLSVARRDDQRDALIRVPPSAVAAGLIARCEIAFGVPNGPANELAAEVVTVDESIPPERHDELHPQGINVYLPERDGVRLTAARTLSRDPQWRQLSVRRLITMIVRTLMGQTQWMVFEPNNSELRAQIRHLLNSFLRGLYRAGAFRGDTEEESFFVQCDAELNPPRVMEAGQVIAHIGVAPAEPLEFIVVRLTRNGDGTLTVED